MKKTPIVYAAVKKTSYFARCIFLIFLFVTAIGQVRAATWYSVGANPTVLGNWNSSAGGGGSAPAAGQFSVAGDTWVVQSVATIPVSTNWSIAGNLSIVNGTLNFSTSTIITIGRNLTLSGSGSISSSATNSINIGGNLSLAGTSYITNTISAATASVRFNGSSTFASPQMITNTSTGTGTGVTYTVLAGSSVKLSGNVSTQALGANNKSVIVNGGFDCAGFVLSGSANFVVGAGDMFYTAHASGIAASAFTGSIQVGGTRTFPGTAHYTYYGTSTGVTGNGLPASITTGSLRINNSVGVTLSQTTAFASGAMLYLQEGVLTNTTINLAMNAGAGLQRDKGSLSVTPAVYLGVNLTYANLGDHQLTLAAGFEWPNNFEGNVIIDHSGATISLQNHKTLRGTLTLVAGTLDATTNNYDMSVSGDWTNNASASAFTPRAGRVDMHGDSALNLGGAFSTAFYDLIVNDEGVTLTNDITVNGQLRLDGKLTIGANDLVLGIASPAVSGGVGPSKNVVTNSSGVVKKMLSANGSYLFPVADAVQYSPVTVNMAGSVYSSGYVTANVAPVKHPSNANTSDYLKRYWSIATSGITTPVYTATATYANADLVGAESDIYMGTYTTALPWTRHGVANAPANTITAAGITAASCQVSGINGTAASVTSVPDTAACSGASFTLAASSPAGSTVDFYYTWAPSVGLSSTVGASVVATPTVTTAYTLTLTDGNGFTASDVSTITIMSGAPVITSLSPLRGNPASAITISGNGFHGLAANNAVYFGATRASVTSASATSLIASVPGGATFMPVTVNNSCAVTGYSSSLFTPTFDNSAYVPGVINFQPAYNYGASGVAATAISDIDGDGKADIIGLRSDSVAIYRNTSTSGSIAAGSFAPRVSYLTGVAPRTVAIGDLNGDGKPDMATANGNSISVYRNTSAIGTVSFTNRTDIAQVAYGIAIADMDVDGKPDILVGFNNLNVAIFRNTSTGTNITFDTAKILFSGSGVGNIAVQDMDNDGRPDIVCPAFYADSVIVHQNNNTPGTIAITSFTRSAFYSGESPAQVAIADYDGDTRLDIAVCNWGGTVSIFRNIHAGGVFGSGSLAPKYDLAVTGTRISVADIDGDGKPDILVGASVLSVFRNTATSGSIGVGSFAARTTFPVSSGLYFSAGDLDGDHKTDVIVGSNVLRNHPLFPITGTAVFCQGDSTVLADSTTGGTWSSSNVGIATVGSATGVVRGVGSGSLTITYTVAGGSATYDITVNAFAGTLSGATAIGIGTTSLLTSSGQAGGTWSTGNIFVAHVNSVGLVSGRGVGTAIITYTVENDCGTSVTTINITVSNTGGAYCETWGDKIPVSAGIAASVSMILNGDVPYVAYSDGLSGYRATVMRYTGGTWSVVGDAGFTTGVANDVHIARSSSGILYVAFSDAAYGGQLTVMKYQGGGWHVVGNSGFSVGYASNISIVVKGAGEPYVAYRDAGSGNKAVVRKFSSSIFTLPWSIVGAAVSTDAAKYISIKLDGSNVPYVVYSDVSLANKATVKKISGGSWVTVGTLAFSTGSALATSLCIDSAGAPYVAYNDSALAYAAVVKKYNGTSWVPVGSPVSSYGTTWKTTMEIDQYGTPYIGFLPSSIGYKPMVMKFNGSTWNPVGNAAISVGSAADISLAINSDGIPVMAYSDNGDGLKAGYMKVTNTLLAPITGAAAVCQAATTTLANSAAGGTWSASANASVGSTTGIVTGTAVGDAFVSYTVQGCAVTRTLAVLPNPPGNLYGGAGSINIGSSFTMIPSMTGGVWSSAGANVSVGSASGLVTGIGGGTATVSYSLTNSCGTASATKIVTVNPVPVVSLTGSTVCADSMIAVTCSQVPVKIVWQKGGLDVATVAAAYAANGTVVAGNGAAGAAVLQLNTPKRIFADVVGNIYIADNGNNRVQKWAPGATSGVTVAGTGSAGVNSSQLRNPGGVFVDGDGNVYVADQLNNRVQKWLPGATSGITVAGSASGLAGTAPSYLNGATDVYVDHSGNIYVTDAINHRVQKWAPGASAGITVAGTGIAGSGANQLREPQGLYVDREGAIYIADFGNHRIQKWTNGALSGSTVAGNGTAGAALTQLRFPADVCADDAGNVFVADGYNHRIVKWLPGATSGIVVGGVGGMGSATSQLLYPVGVCLNDSGHLYVSEETGIRVKKFAASITTTFLASVPGSYTALVTAKGGSVTSNAVTVDANPAVCVLYGGNNRLNIGNTCTLKPTVAGGVWSAANANATVSAAGLVTAVAAGTVTMSYSIANTCGSAVITRVVTVNAGPSVSLTGSTTCVGSTLSVTSSQRPIQIAWRRNDTVVNTITPTYAANGITVAGTGSSGAGASQLTYPLGVYANVLGNVYVSDQANARIQRWLPGAVIGTTIAGTGIAGGGAGQFQNPAGIYVDGNENIYVADGGNNRIQKWLPGATGGITVAGLSGNFQDVHVDDADNLYAVDLTNDCVRKWIAGSLGTTITVAGIGGEGAGANQLHAPSGIFVDKAGVIYIADLANNRVQKWVPGAATGTTIAGTGIAGSGANQFSGPSDVSVDPAGNVFVTDRINHRVMKWMAGAASGVRVAGTGIQGSAANQLKYPNSSFISDSGHIYVVETDGHKVKKFVASIDMGYTALTPGIYTAEVVTAGGTVVAGSVTISSLPDAITGTATVCTGKATTLASAPAGGAWSSSSASVAAVASATGIVSGIAPGTSIITYAVPTGCFITKVVTVNASPGAITGAATVCVDANITLGSATAGGTWSSDNTIVATIVAGTGFVTGANAGTCTMSYTVASGCNTVAVVTVNALPASITGSATVCAASTAALASTTGGGVWSISNAAVATIGTDDGSVTGIAPGSTAVSYTLGTGCMVVRAVTVNALPDPITGAASVCMGANTTLATAATGGTWSSSNTAKGTVSTVGVVRGIASGTTTISYTNSDGCASTRMVTVREAPSAITGGSLVCIGLTSALASTPIGGTWTSNNPGKVTVGAANGVLTAITTGTTTISYTLSSGCRVTRIATVNAAIAEITGTFVVCPGVTTDLSCATGGGTWASSATGKALVNVSSGLVSGVAVGTTTISYIVSAGCRSTKVVTINSMPSAIAGASAICNGGIVMLTNAVSGGTWKSGTVATAFVDEMSGRAIGVSAGTAMITYTTGACAVARVLTVTSTNSGWPIAGPSNVLAGQSISLTTNAVGGTWSAGNSNAGISASGVVTGNTAGTVVISYTTASCGTVTAPVIVNGLIPPVASLSLTGAACPSVSTLKVTSDELPTRIIWLRNGVAVDSMVPMIDTNGTTLIGGSFLDGPKDVTIDKSGNIYIADNFGDRIMKWTKDAPAPVMVAGTGTPGTAANRLKQPHSIFVDDTGNMFIADEGNHRVQKWPLGAISGITVAGTGISGSGPGQLANPKSVYLDAGRNMYILDGLNNRVQKWAPGASYGVTVAGIGVASASAAGMGQPEFLSFDAAGNMYICEWIGHRVQKWAPGASKGTIVAGTGDIGSELTKAYNPLGLSVDKYGNVYVAERPNCRVQKWTPGSTGGTRVVGKAGYSSASPDGLVGPANIFFDSSGSLYVCDEWGNRLMRYDRVGMSYSPAEDGIYTAVVVGPGGRDTTGPVAINTTPVITGNSSVCIGEAITLASAISGGTWSSVTPTIAAAGSAGVISGLAHGTAIVSYTLATACFDTAVVTVNALPTGSISGTTSIPFGGTAVLTFTGITGDQVYYWNGSATVSTTISGFGTATVAVSPATTTVYSLTSGTSASGCSDTITGQTATVTVSSTPVANISGLSAICTGDSRVITFNGTSEATVYYTTDHGVTTSGILLSSGGSYSMSVSPSATTTYRLTSITSGAYTGPLSDSVIITVNPLPAAITGSNAICRGQFAAYVNTVMGGTWSSGNPGVAVAGTASGIVSAFSAGTTILTYSLSTGCFTIKTISVNPLPAPITGADNVCRGSATTLSNTTVAGTWSSGHACALVGSVSGTVAGVTAGTALISYTLSTGCYTTASVTVLALPDAGAITGATSVCPGFSTDLNNIVPGGVWSISDTAIATVDDTGAVTGVTDGTAWVTYTAGNSCGTDVAVIQVTVNSVADAGGIAGADEVCVGSAITLTSVVAGGTWSSGDPDIAAIGSSSGVVTGSSDGSVTIYYEVANGCGSAATSRVVTVNPLPDGITGPNNVCQGAAVALVNSVAGGAWSTSNANASVGSVSGIVTGATPGTSIVTYTLPGGCMTTNTLTINILPAAIAGTDVVCVGLTTIYSSATTGGIWSSSSTNAVAGTSGVIVGASHGTAVITYMLNTGCAVMKEITSNLAPAAITGANIVCEHASTPIASATMGGTWSSSSAHAVIGATGTLTGASAGTALITYMLTTGCLTSREVSVNETPAVISGVSTLCEADTTVLASATAGGTWSSSSAKAAIGTSGIVSGISTGTATITYALNTGCASTMDVTVNALPSAIGGISAVCEGLTTTLTSATVGGAWSSSNFHTAVDTSGIVTGASVGMSTITYALGTGCRATSEVTVNEMPVPVTGAGQVCKTASVSLFSLTVGGIWTSSNSNVSVGSTGIVIGVISGSATISYTLPAGCVVTKEITVNSLPELSGAIDVCEEGAASLSADIEGGSWSSVSSHGSVSSLGVVSGLSAGVVAISYELPTGCTATHDITVNPLPDAITGTAAVCQGATTVLSSLTAGGIWSSSSNAAVGSAGVVTGVAPGTAVVTYTVNTGCSTTQVVTVNSLPDFIAGPSALCVGTTAALVSATPDGTWSSSNSNAIVGTSGTVTGMSAGTVAITYTVSTGCSAVKEIAVNVLPAGITGNANACEGVTTSLASASAGGVWSSSSINAIVDINGLVTGVLEGTATVTYTLGNGCAASRDITVNANPEFISGPGNVCVAGVVTLMSASAGGTWTSGNAHAVAGAATGNITGVSAGTTIITYTLPSGCITIKFVTVSAFPYVDTITNTGTLCLGGTRSLGNSSGGGVWSTSDASIATVGTSGIVTGVSGGTATISYTIVNSCSSVAATAVVTVNTTLSAIGGVAIICIGVSTTLTNSVSGGIWASSNPSVAVVDSVTGTVTGMAAGVANITYQINEDCYSVRAIAVHNALPPVTGSSVICSGDAFTTLDNPVAGGSWTSSNAAIAAVDFASGVVTPVAHGSVMITYAFSSSCFISRPLYVLPSPLPIIGNGSVCEGATTDLSDYMGTGTWTSSDPGVAAIGVGSGTVTGIAAGTATITYLLYTGCYTTRVQTVNLTPAPVTGTPVVCAGSTTIFSTVTTGGSWLSSHTTTATIDSVSGIATGVLGGYTAIRYRMPSGCSAARIATVNNLPAPIGGSLAICEGGSGTLTNSTPGGAWSSLSIGIVPIGATSGLFAGLTAGTAAISYTIGTGCARSATVTVNNVPPDISGSTEFCVGSTLLFSNTLAGGSWSSSNTSRATINVLTGVATGLTAGVATISYAVPGAGCFTAQQVTVNANPLPVIGVSGVCVGSSATFSHPVGAGVWSSSSTAVGTIASLSGVFTGISVGATIVTYTLSSGCFKTMMVNVLPLPLMTTSGVLCESASVGIGSYPAGGTWTSGTPSVATVGATSGIVSGIAAGTALIFYTASPGCMSVREMTINPIPDPITAVAAVCAGSSEVLSSTSSGGTWSSSNILKATIGSASGIVAGISAGTVSISYTLATGCRTGIVVTVGVLPSVFGGTLSVCEGSTTSLGSSPAGGTWSSENAAVADITATSGIVAGGSAGTVTISYKQAGCVRTGTVTVHPALPAIAGDFTVCAGNTTVLSNAVTGGTWTCTGTAYAVVGPSTGMVTGMSAGTATITYRTAPTCFTAAQVTVNSVLPAITGITGICVGFSTALSIAATGGSWVSGNGARAVVDPESGVVTALSAGTVQISYLQSTGCYKTINIVVSPQPAAIGGNPSVCIGSGTTLTNTTGGGTWACSAATTAMSPGSGLVTGVAVGTSTVTYMVYTGCYATRDVTVNPLPDSIVGPPSVCTGNTAVFTSPGVGGVWNSSSLSVATVGSSSGIVAAMAGGGTTISYTLTTGCRRTQALTVYSSPATITGTASIYLGAATTLSCITTGGTWSSSNVEVATIGATSAVVSSVSAGTTVITYRVTATGCYKLREVTVNMLPSSKPAVTDLNTVESGGVDIYPNPTTGTLTLRAAVDGVFALFTLEGKQVEQYKVNAASTVISLPYNLAAGSYICRFIGSDGRIRRMTLVYKP